LRTLGAGRRPPGSRACRDYEKAATLSMAGRRKMPHRRTWWFRPRGNGARRTGML